jgi:hypothetical protein
MVLALAVGCGRDLKFDENFTTRTPTPASLQISAGATATPRPGA